MSRSPDEHSKKRSMARRRPSKRLAGKPIENISLTQPDITTEAAYHYSINSLRVFKPMEAGAKFTATKPH